MLQIFFLTTYKIFSDISACHRKSFNMPHLPRMPWVSERLVYSGGGGVKPPDRENYTALQITWSFRGNLVVTSSVPANITPPLPPPKQPSSSIIVPAHITHLTNKYSSSHHVEGKLIKYFTTYSKLIFK